MWWSRKPMQLLKVDAKLSSEQLGNQLADRCLEAESRK